MCFNVRNSLKPTETRTTAPPRPLEKGAQIYPATDSLPHLRIVSVVVILIIEELRSHHNAAVYMPEVTPRSAHDEGCTTGVHEHGVSKESTGGVCTKGKQGREWVNKDTISKSISLLTGSQE